MVDSREQSFSDVSRPAANDLPRAVLDNSLQLIPGASLLQPWLALIIASPLQKRRDAYIQDVADRVEELERQGRVSFDDLKTNDAFTSAMYQGVRAAISTASTHKHTALRNAALNCALRLNPEVDLLEMFLRYLDDFTPMHIKLLLLFNDPAGSLKARGQTLDEPASGWNIIDACLPELNENKTTVVQAWEELRDRGLVQATSLETTPSGRALASRLGQKFIAFISDPPPSVEE